MTLQHDDHGRYRLRELLGRGGMGEVWEAYDARLDRDVAIKFLSSAVLDATDRDRFAREAKVAAQLTHPNIVAIHDAGEWGDRPFIVLELVRGVTLAEELVDNGPFPVQRAVQVSGQLADGLDAAHAVGVVHRDVKPGNVIGMPDGRVKILDFGVAQLLDERATRLTRSGLLVGTAAYSAPEQITVGVADARSDLYALGCVLYELLTGRPPFEGDLAAVAYGHVHRLPTAASELRPGLPAELESLLSVLLAKDPAARPGSAAEVREWLRQPTISQQLSAMPRPLPMESPVDPSGSTTPMASMGAAAPTTPQQQTPMASASPSPGADTPMRTSVLGQGPPGSAGDPYTADPAEERDRARARRRRRWWFGAVAASAMLALMVGMVVAIIRGLDGGPGDEPAVAETPQPTSTPDNDADGGDHDGDNRDPLWARSLEREMDQLRDAGVIGGDVAKDIQNEIDEAIEQDDPEKVQKELEKLRARLDKDAEKWQKYSEDWQQRAEEWDSEWTDGLPATP